LTVIAKKLEWFKSAITDDNENEKMSDENENTEAHNLKNKTIYTIADHHSLLEL